MEFNEKLLKRRIFLPINFPYPLLTSFNIDFRLWDNKKKQPYISEFKSTWC